MENKPLLFGIAGFLLGGLLVAVAATTFDKPSESGMHGQGMSMSDMTDTLRNKSGGDYDKAFVALMIDHHEAAVAMAHLSDTKAKHDEIKRLSSDIIIAQGKEIEQLKQWQIDWKY